MNQLTITATIPSLSSLTPIATNTYAFVVKFLNSSGSGLNSSYIPNSYSTTVVTTSTTFQVIVPITDGNYTINNVTVKLYAGTDTNCCFASTVQNLVNTQTSTVAARMVARGYPEHMELTKTPEASGYRIIDTTNLTLTSGYEWSYFLNEHWIKTSTPLNVLWPSDTPLIIEKAQSKIGLDSFNRWAPGEPGGYYSEDSAITFSGNCSFTYQSLSFNS